MYNLHISRRAIKDITHLPKDYAVFLRELVSSETGRMSRSK
jgi:mRNA-degrading endonuclease RelE of RelBE toxin-antitoxin system